MPVSVKSEMQGSEEFIDLTVDENLDLLKLSLDVRDLTFVY